MHEVLGAVKFMHDNEIVHRDLKVSTDNINFIILLYVDFDFFNDWVTHNFLYMHKKRQRFLGNRCALFFSFFCCSNCTRYIL